MNRLYIIISAVVLSALYMGFTWGFYAHKLINKQAVFSLPAEMMAFYKKNLRFIEEASIDADRRRYAVKGEAARHYIDIDHFGDSAVFIMPRYWKDAVAKYSEDSLQQYGIVPWHINIMYYRLRDAFFVRDPKAILRNSADLGHYIADAHVPLHTTKNYNGQLTDQLGIHAFWESRLPELFSDSYDLFVGRASYLDNPQLAAWDIVTRAHLALDSVLTFEKDLSERSKNKYSYETKGTQSAKVYAQKYAAAYHEMLDGMVERQLRSSIIMVANFWFTAWVDAGQPDLKELINYQPSEEELIDRKESLKEWKMQIYRVREHELPVKD
jgi:hypothetical protein